MTRLSPRHWLNSFILGPSKLKPTTSHVTEVEQNASVPARFSFVSLWMISLFPEGKERNSRVGTLDDQLDGVRHRNEHISTKILSESADSDDEKRRRRVVNCFHTFTQRVASPFLESKKWIFHRFVEFCSPTIERAAARWIRALAFNWKIFRRTRPWPADTKRGNFEKKIILKKSFEAFAADQLAASEKISFISSGSVRRKRRNGAAPSDGATIAVTCARRVDGAGAGKRETLRPDAVWRANSRHVFSFFSRGRPLPDSARLRPPDPLAPVGRFERNPLAETRKTQVAVFGVCVCCSRAD